MILRSRRPRISAALLAVLVVLTAATAAADAPRPAYFDQPARIIPPVGYNRGVEYPVFVVLPPTGAHASLVARYFGLDPARQRRFVLIFPAGAPTRAEYLPDFLAFVEGYETQVLAAIDRALEEFSTDPERVYLGGYSLGGDLSWAISVRNPRRIAGAVIAGSRTSYPPPDGTFDAMAAAGFRGALLIGNREEAVRYRGINVARTRFEAGGVPFMYEEYAGGHVIPPASLLNRAVTFVTGEEARAEAGTAVAAGPPRRATGMLDYTSMDRLALFADIPAELGTAGITTPRDTRVGVRLEWPWRRGVARTTVEYSGTTTAAGTAAAVLHQDLLVGIGDRHLWGGGLGWDWVADVDGAAAFRTVDLLGFWGVRNPWIIPAGAHDPYRVDSLLILRYRLPRGIAAGPSPWQFANLRAEYLLRIGDRFVVDAAGGVSTIQNESVGTLDELAGRLDQRVEAEVGVGLRAPSPLLWRVGYRWRSERTLPAGSWTGRGVGTVGVEFSY